MNSIEKLDEFVIKNECDYTIKVPNLDLINKTEELIKIKFGTQLTNYLLKYGYLGYKSAELYGMNSNQGLNSDLFEQTMYLHNDFEITRPYIAIDKLNDSVYTLIDSNDIIYICDLVKNKIENTNIKLFDYILRRFNGEMK